MTCFRLLMEYHSFLYDVDKVYDKWSNLVSVSLRSIIHSYSTKVKNYSSCGLSRFPSPYGVIFILTLYKRLAMKAIEDCFRLLTELYSFLPPSQNIRQLYQLSFRLLTEYHSFLLFLLFYFNCFILSMGFRLLTEYHSFLFYSKYYS